MKRSKIYHLAQIAVITTPCIAPEDKVKVLKELSSDEDIALYSEEQAEKKAAEVAE